MTIFWQEARAHQTLVLRKRDVKGNYKAKFGIEKLMIEHEKKKVIKFIINFTLLINYRFNLMN